MFSSTPQPKNNNTTTPDSKEDQTPKVVTQHLTTSIAYHNEKQELCLSHCVQRMYISPYYGEFKLYDGSERLLCTSEGGKLNLLKKDLKERDAQVWHDARSLCNESSEIRQEYRVVDPGLDCNNVPLLIRLVDAPPFSADRGAIIHLPVFYNVTNVWDPQAKKLKYASH